MNWTFLSSSKSVLFHNDLESDPITQVTPHTGDINSAIFNHNGHVVATGGVDGSVRVTHIQKKLEILNLVEHGPVF
jgi:WD40 repeat protein